MNDMANWFVQKLSLESRLRQADERIANLRSEIEELEDVLERQRCELMDLRDANDNLERQLESRERDTWRPHH